jgi:signal transduction histidine kinase/DNA-binding response OmpR family regulator
VIRHPGLRAAALAAATIAIGAVLVASPFYATLSAALDDTLLRLDTRLTASRAASDAVVVVDFDDTSLEALRPALGPWPYRRDVHATLVDFLREAGARAIVLDIVFSDPRDGDAELARRIAGQRDVVLAAAALRDGEPRPSGPREAVERLSGPAVPGIAALPWPSVALPAPALRDVLFGPGSVGIVTAPLDDDGHLRHLPLLHVADGRTWPSLALAALVAPAPASAPLPSVTANGAALAFGTHRWPIDDRARIRFTFADAAARLPMLPARLVLGAALGRDDPAPVRSAVRGRTVFVGSSAFLGDRVITSAGQLPGVSVLAAEYDALRRDDLVRDAPLPQTLALCALALLPLAFAAWRGRPSPRRDATVTVLTAAGLVVIVLGVLAASRVLLPLAMPLAVLAIAFALDALAQWGRSVQANLRLAEERRLADAANAAKSDFLACMSHELRTPLHAMLGMADALGQTPLDAAQRHRVDVLRQSGATLASLIDDLLDLSRIEADRLSLHVEPFALHALLDAQRALFEERARDKGLRLEVRVAPAAGTTVSGDEKRFAQILVNLVGNAIKFTQAGGVTIEVDRTPRGLLHVAVRDTGIGIAASKLESIFEPFSQADGSITRHFGGTGLGLSITRRLAGLMGGRAWVESEPGVGSTFHVTADFPVVADAPPVPAALAASSAPASSPPPTARADDAPSPARLPADAGVDILLAEDNEVNVIVMKAMLDGTPHRLEAAPSGEAALERFRQRHFGLVLMDIHMPGIDGYATTRALREMEQQTGRARTPVLALTAGALDSDRSASLAAGCDDHLVKPIGLRQLLEAIAMHGRVAATSTETGPGAGPRGDAVEPPPAGAPEDDASSQRRRAHAKVFFGSWQRSFDGARDAGDTARAQALCDDLNRIARGVDELELAAAAAALGALLATDDAPTTRESFAVVERELRRLIAQRPAAD